MAAYHEKLQAIWNGLQNSELVKTKVTSKENIEEFTEFINKLLPLSPQDILIWEFVKYTFQQNKTKFYEYIGAANVPYYVLMIGCGAVIAELKIVGLVDIRLLSDKSKFIVQPRQADVLLTRPPKNQRNKRGPRQQRIINKQYVAISTVSHPITIPPLPEERRIDISKECTTPTKSYAEAAKGDCKPTNWADE